MIVESDDPAVVVDSFKTFKDIFKLEAVVVHGFDWEYDDMYDAINRLNKKYKQHDIICLGMHPDTEGEPLPIAYTYKHEPLIIIQRISTLRQARKRLKNTDYYRYFLNDTK